MPELRKDSILNRWVILSSERAHRPTDFAKNPVVIRGSQSCPFCYGHEDKTPPEIMAQRPNGSPPDTPGWNLRVVPNKFPALDGKDAVERVSDGLFHKISGAGAHEVIIESPDHQAALADLTGKQIEDVLRAYRRRILALQEDERFEYVLVFKNYGEAAGASLEHSHSQVIALPIVPPTVREEVEAAQQYYGREGRCVFCDLIRREREERVRVIAEDEDFITLAPYAPRFPFESWILPRRHYHAFEQAPGEPYAALAHALKDLLTRADRVLNRPAYNFVVHTAPLREDTKDFFHWHIEYMPRLTSIAGFEWGTGVYINPTPPEEAARALREAAGSFSMP